MRERAKQDKAAKRMLLVAIKEEVVLVGGAARGVSGQNLIVDGGLVCH